MQVITATQLNQWADKIESRSLLPELVKKLIYASKHGLTDVDIPTGEQIQHPGWDGVVVSKSESNDNEVFLPNGTCLIEMGTNKDIKVKAEDDYRKRCNDSHGYNKKKCAFVFITPRDWAQGRDWEKEKSNTGEWKCVKVITATILADWIEQCPSVCSWLNNVLGVPVDIVDIETFWNQWSTNTKGSKLNFSFAIGGRDKENENLMEALETPSSICVKSQSPNESLAFVVASILNNGNKKISNRAIISKDNNTTDYLIKSFKNLIILHTGDSNIQYSQDAKDNNISIVYFITPEQKKTNCDIEITLRQPEVATFIKSLTSTLGDENLSKQYAHDTGKSISILRRRLGFNGAMPEWTKPENMVQLLPAFILGAWNENCDGDKDAVAKLAHSDYAEYSKVVNVWLHKEDPPFTKIGDVWLVKSPYDVMTAALPYIKGNKELLDILKSVSPSISDDVDTNIRQDWSTEFNWNKFNLQYSYSLRKSILRSLIILSVSNDTNLIDFVDDIIRESIRPTVDWWLTACQSGILSLMAEASPQVFLNTVEDDIESEHSAIKTIFKNDFAHESYFGNGAHYTSILHAIETAAWIPDCLPMASDILLSLSKFGKKKGWANNASESLKDIYHVFFPHTFATLDQRIEKLKLMSDIEPDITFQLCYDILKGRNHSVMISSSSTLWRTFGKSQPFVNKINDIERSLDCLVEICCKKENIRENEYIALIDIAGDRQNPKISIESKNKVLAKLDETALQFKGNQNILKKLHSLDYLNFELSDKKHSQRDLWEESLIEKVEPEDIIEREVWKFSNSYAEPSTYDKDYNKIPEKKDKNREIAFKRIKETKGIVGIDKLAKEADDPFYVGLCLAKEDDHAKYVDFILQHKDIRGLAGAFFRTIYYNDKRLFDDIISSDEYDINTKVFILSSLNTMNVDLKEYLEKVSDKFRKMFWKAIGSNPFVDTAVLEYSTLGFCMVEKYDAAVILIHHAKYNHIVISTKTIINALSGILTHPKQLLGNDLAYDLQDIIEDLDKREDADDRDVIEIEFLYSVWRNEDISKDTRLVKSLYTDPQLMYSMIKSIYKQEHANYEDIVVSQKDANIAQACYRILSNLRSIPYINDKGIVDKERLNDYIKDLYDYGLDDDRERVTCMEIGSLLGNAPINESFPQNEICEILEHYNNKSMLNAFQIRLYNRRGIVSYALLEGGDQERNLANFMGKCIDKTKLKYPHVANSVFRVLRRTYLGEAERRDNSAEFERMEI